MKHYLSVTILALSAIIAMAAPGGSTVRFTNGDQLTGSLEAITPERLMWDSPTLAKSTPFHLAAISEIKLAHKLTGRKPGHEATLSLTNGDTLNGQLVTVTDDAVVLDTPYAGQLKLNPLMVDGIKIVDSPPLLYHGPIGLEGWVQSKDKPSWTFENNSFQASLNGGIARDVKLPEEFSIACDFEWQEGYLGFDIGFLVDGQSSTATDKGYTLSVRTRYVSLKRAKPGKVFERAESVPVFQENQSAHVELRVSQKSGKICLLVDSQPVQVWTDVDIALSERGSGLRFVNQNSKSELAVSNIQITAWDGEVTEPILDSVSPDDEEADPEGQDASENPRPMPAPSPSGRMELRNGDSIVGQVLSITQGVITLKTPFREVKLPIESLRSIALKPGEKERCKRESGDVRAHFPDGSSVVFRFLSFSNGELTGSSQNFGTAVFKLSAFNSIDFNINESGDHASSAEEESGERVEGP